MTKPHYIYRYFIRCDPGPENPPGTTYGAKVFSRGGFFMVWQYAWRRPINRPR